MSDYALGKKAIAICDRCGFQYKLNQLRPQFTDLRNTGLLVCPSCLDEENPQLQLGRWPINDPEALRDPRPDTNQNVSRSLSAFDPIVDFEIDIQLGDVFAG